MGHGVDDLRLDPMASQVEVRHDLPLALVQGVAASAQRGYQNSLVRLVAPQRTHVVVRQAAPAPRKGHPAHPTERQEGLLAAVGLERIRKIRHVLQTAGEGDRAACAHALRARVV